CALPIFSLFTPSCSKVFQSTSSALKRYSFFSCVCGVACAVCGVSTSFLVSCCCSFGSLTSCFAMTASPSLVGASTCFCISLAVSTASFAGTLKNEKWVGSLSCRQKLEKKLVNKSPVLSTRISWLWFFLVASTVFRLPISSTRVTAWIFFFSLSITNSTSESCSSYCCRFSFVCSFMILIFLIFTLSESTPYDSPIYLPVLG